MVSRAIRRLGNQVHDDVKVTSSAITIHWVLAAHCGFGYLPSGCRAWCHHATHTPCHGGWHPSRNHQGGTLCMCLYVRFREQTADGWDMWGECFRVHVLA